MNIYWMSIRNLKHDPLRLLVGANEWTHIFKLSVSEGPALLRMEASLEDRVSAGEQGRVRPQEKSADTKHYGGHGRRKTGQPFAEDEVDGKNHGCEASRRGHVHLVAAGQIGNEQQHRGQRSLVDIQATAPGTEHDHGDRDSKIHWVDLLPGEHRPSGGGLPEENLPYRLITGESEQLGGQRRCGSPPVDLGLGEDQWIAELHVQKSDIGDQTATR